MSFNIRLNNNCSFYGTNLHSFPIGLSEKGTTLKILIGINLQRKIKIII